MPGMEIPEDLIELKRRFRALEEEQRVFVGTLPSSVEIAAGRAELSPEQMAESKRLRGALEATTTAIYRHPFLAGLTGVERLQADEAASKAARPPAPHAS